jgi:hypothetical protein
VKNSSSLSRRRAVEHRAMLRALVAHRAVTTHRARSGRPLAVNWVACAAKGHHRGPWPSGPLWPWAAVRPREIVDFSIFLWIYSNEIQIQFGLNLNLSKFVQTGYLNEFNPSL